MKGKIIALLTMLLIGLLTASFANAFTKEQIVYVEVDGDEAIDGKDVVVERGDTLSIKVRLKGLAVDENNMVVRAEIFGYEHNIREVISDEVDTFDLGANEVLTRKLSISLPQKMDPKDNKYDLRIWIGSRTGDVVEFRYPLKVKGKRHELAIRDVILNPSDEITAGRYLIATVRVQNYGKRDEDGVKVTVSIPGLGVSASDYIEELERNGQDDDSATSEELLLRIPTNAESGEYTVRTTVEYNDGFYVETSEDTITVIGQEGAVSSTEEKTVINVGIESQDVNAGQTAVYPIVITNTASSARTYTVSVSGTSGWATAVVQPTNVVTVGAGATATVTISVTTSDSASAGEKAFVVEVKSASQTAQIPLKAVVSEEPTSRWGSIKTFLEVALIVLVVLLVILGLIIGFNRLKGDEDEDEDEDEDKGDSKKTYY